MARRPGLNRYPARKPPENLAELLWLLGTPPDPWKEGRQADSRSDPL